eukprot:scaffold100_cov357-Prasinococcus_capsulatus_cf.AAC.29
MGAGSSILPLPPSPFRVLTPPYVDPSALGVDPPPRLSRPRGASASLLQPYKVCRWLPTLSSQRTSSVGSSSKRRRAVVGVDSNTANGSTLRSSLGAAAPLGPRWYAAERGLLALLAGERMRAVGGNVLGALRRSRQTPLQ